MKKFLSLALALVAPLAFGADQAFKAFVPAQPAASAQTGAEVLPEVQSTNTAKVTTAQLATYVLGTPLTSSVITGKFSGTCDLTTFLRGDGACSLVSLTSNVSGILPAANGGNGNGFFAVSGPATSTKTFTFPNASATVLTTNAAVTTGQGGTGLTSATDDAALVGNGTTWAATAIPNCGSSTQALAYSTSTNSFSCQTVTGSGGSPGGSTTQVQFNNAGAFGGDAGFTYNSANDLLILGESGITPHIQGWPGSSSASGSLIFESQAGPAGFSSGDLTVQTGTGGSSSSASGALNVLTGAGGATNGASGALAISTGASSGSGAAGALTITGGNGGTTGTGSSVTIKSGAGGSTSGSAGFSTFAGGDATGTNRDAGGALFRGGDPTGSGTGGTANIRGGNTTGGTGGDVILRGGTSGGGNPGELRMYTGDGAQTERLRVTRTGEWLVNASAGSSGQVLTSGGAGTTPTWAAVPGAGGPTTFVRKGADTSRNTTTTVTADPDLQFSSLAAGTYNIHCVIFATTTLAGQSLKFDLASSGAVTSSVWSAQINDTGSIPAAVAAQFGTATNVANYPASGSTSIFDIDSYVITSASSVFSFQWAQGTSNATNLTVKQGSWCTIR